MIKLELHPKPAQLTDQLVCQQTNEYKNDKTKRVWNILWLKNAIAAMSYNKCCYSEVCINQESRYMEIDHYLPKSIYPDKVMEWGNLLPSCKACNIAKREHDPVREPIVNPFTDHPKEYFYFQGWAYKVRPSLNESEMQKARLTLKVLKLNDINQWGKKRNQLIEWLQERLLHILREKDAVCSVTSLKRIMQEGNRREEYAALVSTTILSNASYQTLETRLRNSDLWDTELQSLKAELEFCGLLK